jgi:hypothetical protein
MRFFSLEKKNPHHIHTNDQWLYAIGAMSAYWLKVKCVHCPIIIKSLSQYLTKQNLALKEVNDTRMQIYESLDISIHDLEREKHQLTIEHSVNKKQIKE